MTDPNKTHDQVPGGIVSWWARNSVAANLLMIVAIVGGFLGYNMLNREVFPTASFNGATVSVSWPGASPQDIEEQIVVRIEEALADMDGIETITSTARESVGYVNIEGKRNVDIGEFIDNIKLEVDSVNNLPPSAYRPIVSQWRNQEQVVGFAVHGDIDRRDLQAIGREVRDEGGPPRRVWQIRVQLRD